MMATGLQDFFTARTWRDRPYMISPFVDFMLVGGLAIIAFTSLFFVVPLGASDFDAKQAKVVLVMGMLSYLINDPHFMVSYQLLYRGYTKKLQRFRENREIWFRYLVAGIIAPLLLTLYFLYGMVSQRMEIFAFAIQGMLILVGWHYVKQAFGVFIMLSSMKKIYYSKWQRRFLVFNSYVVWFCYAASFFVGNGVTEERAQSITPLQDFFGVQYGNIPQFITAPSFTEISGGIFILCAMSAILVIIWEKKRPSLTAITGYLSMYYLLFAASFHPLWILIYPAFHSLQYLMFVYAYKRGETLTRLEEPAVVPGKVKYRLALFVTSTLVLGALFFNFIPRALEGWINPDSSFLFPLTAAMIIGINIHHYFIDNVIWRKEHTELSAYLFRRP